jgi:hypothetical protein
MVLASYYPRENGVVGLMNKNLIKIMKKMDIDYHKKWHNIDRDWMIILFFIYLHSFGVEKNWGNHIARSS